MTRTVDESTLPNELSLGAAVAAAYARDLARCEEALVAGLPTLVECDKELTPFFYAELRNRLKRREIRCVYLDGRAPPDGPPQGIVATMIGQLRDAVRGAVGERVIVLPHLDLLTTSGAGLTAEAREVIPLMYENPEILWLGFKDPSFAVPRVIEKVFPNHQSVIGVPRDRLAHLVTKREARKFGRAFDPYKLYGHVSGMNVVRFRRVLSGLSGEDYPADARPAFAHLRAATLPHNDFVLPDVDLDRDVGGYEKVKTRIRREILDVLAYKETLEDDDAIARVEALVPRGMIFWGPPGTGKTLFAKAVATALGAAITVVSGPELKSKWVGESEENLRQIFVRARKSAPSIIVFDELDSFASARGTYSGSGVEHSMVNQLLTEMDGFRKEELVFVVGTTNFVEALDPALLRPGRFEFHLQIPYPDAHDRRAILGIHDDKLRLALTPEAFDFAVARTSDVVPGGETPYSGDHLQALCRALARTRLRERKVDATRPVDVDRAIDEYADRPELTSAEERVVATHEAGHAVCALFCEHARPIERISIRGDMGGSLGHVRYADPAHRYVVSRARIEADLCVLYGGREAEILLCGEASMGASGDIDRATSIARAFVEEFGFAGTTLGVRTFHGDKLATTSEATRSALEAAVREVLDRARAQAASILSSNVGVLTSLRDLLVEKKSLDRAGIAHLVGPATPAAEPAPKPKKGKK